MVANALMLAIDVGGSKFMVGYVSSSGEILSQERFEWGDSDRSPDMVVELIGDAVRNHSLRYPELSSRAVAAGMTLPGFVDAAKGVWVESDYMRAYDYPVAARMSSKVGLPVFVDNDCKACALSERVFGAGASADTYLYITVSNGIGGAMYIDGQPYGGAFGHAGEVGLFVVERDGRVSETDCSGVLEMYASGRGFHQTYVELGGQKLDEEGHETGGAYVAKQAREGQEAAVQTFVQQGRYIGRALAWAINMLDPERVIVGGGLSMVFNSYRSPLIESLQRCCPNYAAHPIPIEPTKLGYSGAFLGAAALALRGTGVCSVPLDGNMEANDEITVTIWPGVECELKLRGARYQGAHGLAGSLSSMVIDDRTNLTLGDALSERRLVSAWRALVQDHVGEGSLMALLSAANGGDASARRVLGDAGVQLGHALAITCVLFDPKRIHIKGGFGACKACFEQALIETLVAETYYRGTLPFEVEVE